MVTNCLLTDGPENEPLLVDEVSSSEHVSKEPGCGAPQPRAGCLSAKWQEFAQKGAESPEPRCSEPTIFHKAIVPELLASEESSHVKDGNWPILNFAE